MLQQAVAAPVRISLVNGQSYTLPAETRQIVILSGEAWLSLGYDNFVARCNERVQIKPGQQDVTITPLGKARLEFMMIE